MSLHALAHHMAAQGRNNDSMLVHMTPKEVGGLHALAIANGGQLTVNPETGLTEAGFLDSLLPALIGFGLNAFVPGLGAAVGGMFGGLSAAAGTGIAVGGLTALATGSLSKGVMAGFGAYGGAGLSGSLMDAGASSIQNAAEVASSPGSARGAFIPAEGVRETALASASPMDRLTAGFSATTQSPEALMNYAGSNYKYGIAAAAPALAGLAEEDDTVTKMPSTGMITPFVMNRKQLARDESLSPSAQQKYLSYGVTPITPFKAAEGGAVQESPTGFIGHFGLDEYGRGASNPDFGKPSTTLPRMSDGPGYTPNGGGTTDPYTQQFIDKAKTYKNTMTGDSASAFDYLMGNRRPPAQTTGGAGTTNRVPTVKMPEIGRAPPDKIDPIISDGDNGIVKLLDRGRGAESAAFTQRPGVNTSDTGGQDFGVTNQPPGAVFNINDFDAVNEFGIGSQPAGTTFDINHFDNLNNTVDNGINSLTENPAVGEGGETINSLISNPAVGEGGETVQNGYFNSITNNPSVGEGGETVNSLISNPAVGEGGETVQSGYTNSLTQNPAVGEGGEAIGEGGIKALQKNQVAALGDSGFYTGDAGDGMDNVDTSNPEIFSQEYVDPRADPMEAAERLEQSEMNEGYFGGFDSGSDSGSDYGGFDSGFGSGFDSGFGGDYGIGGGGDYGYDMSYRAKGGPIKSNFKNARNINAYRSGLENYAGGGLGSLGGYSDGGRLLRGPGDGVSDSIPATIGQRQPARLADGEFVVPARIVSELGNGSTEAGARQLYAMMDRIQKGRKKTVGKNKVAANTRSAKHLPA